MRTWFEWLDNRLQICSTQVQILPFALVKLSLVLFELSAKWPCGEERMGSSLCVLVFIVFLVLKLVGVGVVATWSWWLVCLPLFIPLLFALAVFVISGGLFVLLASVLAVFGGRRK